MNSRFKFRVYDKLLKQYIKWSPVIPFDSNEYVIEQWTGYFDRDNKEIYEGDIITVANVHIIKAKSYYSVIEFMHGAFCTLPYIAGKPRDFDYELDYGMPGNCQGTGNPWVVIGNITENPELIADES